MTPEQAREILANWPDHGDADLRTAARALLTQGAPDDTPQARRFANLGLRNGDPDWLQH